MCFPGWVATYRVVPAAAVASLAAAAIAAALLHHPGLS